MKMQGDSFSNNMVSVGSGKMSFEEYKGGRISRN